MKEQIDEQLAYLLELLTLEREYEQESDGRIMQNLRLKMLRQIVDTLREIEGEIMDALVIVNSLPTLHKIRAMGERELAKITGDWIGQEWDEM